MSSSTHLHATSTPHVLKFLQLLLNIERLSLSTEEKEYAKFFQSSGELIRDFFGANRVSAFVFLPDEERFVDGWSMVNPETTSEKSRARAWATLYQQQPFSTIHRSWVHHPIEDQARQTSTLPQHVAWMVPWNEQKPLEGFLVIEEPHHPIEHDAQFTNLLMTLATVIYSIIRRLQTGLMARVSTSAVDEINYRIAQFSHQIRTPLMGMLNAMQLMADQQASSSQKEYFDIAWNSAKTMQLMLDRILDIAKLDSYHPQNQLQAFDLETELLVVIKNQILSAQEKGLLLQLELEPPLNFKVIGDNVVLHHVLLNLLSNAIKYTNEGSVTLIVKTINLNRESIQLEFSVKDTGIGIPRAYLSQLFKPYFRVNDLYSQVSSGTGLGLPIVQDILQRVKSRLVIDTVEGQGSTFSFALWFKIMEDSSLYDFHHLQTKHACIVYQGSHPSQSLVSRLESLSLPFSSIADTSLSSSTTLQQSLRSTDYLILDGSSKWTVEWMSHPPITLPDSICTIGYYCCKEVGNSLRTASIQTWLSSTLSRLEWRDILLKSQAKKNNTVTPKIKHMIQPWKVMLVDDNPINIKTLEALLIKAGLDVTIATDSIQGLRQISNDLFDFILLDIKMPELSGPEVLQRIRLMRHPNATIPIFAATAYAFDKEKKEFLDLGFNEVITKPVDINFLLRLMMQYKEVHFDEIVAPTWGAPTQQETFNEDEFNHHYEGLDSLKSEVMQLFFEQSEGSLRRIQSAISDMNFEKIAFEAHYYKGSCSYLSAPRITWICTKLIEFAKRKDAEPIPQLMAQLIRETMLFNYRIRDYLGHQGPSPERPLQTTSPRPSHQP